MALLQTYNASNRVIDNDKTVTYSMVRVNGSWVKDTGPLPWQETTYNWMWEYHRYCQKSYRYVGMDLTTANSCAAAMITKYTRTFYTSQWDTSRGEWADVAGGTKPMAEVTVQKNQGCMYDVIVNVREDDVRMRKTVATPSSLFTNENNRDYDTGN